MKISVTPIELVSRVTDILGISYLCRCILHLLYPRHIRVFNYHHVPKNEMPAFIEQVEYLLSVFDPATPDDLLQQIAGNPKHKRSLFILTFDDGFQSQGTYVADYLKQRNIKGWFFIPTRAPDIAPSLQSSWAITNQVLREHENAEVDGRVFAEWRTWEELSQFHVIGSHTHSHKRFTPDTPAKVVKEQLTQSLETIELKFAESPFPLSFCWVGGELGSYSRTGVEEIKKTKVKLGFTTCSLPVTCATSPYRIERTNLESNHSLSRVKMSISGIVDIRYFLKRRKLRKIFSCTSTLS